MRSLLTLLTAFVIAFNLFAQLPSKADNSIFKLDPKLSAFISNSQMECIYQYKVVSPKRETAANPNETGTITDTYTTILQANASVSKFWDWNLLKKDSILYSSPVQF